MRTLSKRPAQSRDVAFLTCVFLLGFLPSILRLSLHSFPITNPWVALGPVVAGFWLAMELRELKVHFVALGTLITVLLWAVNFLMLAGSSCCATM